MTASAMVLALAKQSKGGVVLVPYRGLYDPGTLTLEAFGAPLPFGIRYIGNSTRSAWKKQVSRMNTLLPGIVKGDDIEALEWTIGKFVVVDDKSMAQGKAKR